MSIFTGQPRLKEAVAELAAATGTDAPAWVDAARRLAVSGFQPWQLEMLAGLQTEPTPALATERHESEWGVKTHG